MSLILKQPASVEGFLRGWKNESLEQIEELYTITFDMQPVCYPYVGYQLVWRKL